MVAGASGGIGRAIAFGLLGAGAEVFMLGRSMAKLVQSPPPKNARAKCHFIVADLTDSSAVGHIAANISPKGRFGCPRFELGIYERSHELTERLIQPVDVAEDPVSAAAPPH